MALCGGLFLAMSSIGAHSDITDSSTESVNRVHKRDRLPLAQINVTRAPVYQLQLPEGCDALVSSQLQSELARIAGRCMS
jgi:hypothetical protein